MPAVIAHFLFERRVLKRLERDGAPVFCRSAADIGAQGPDMLYFHRVFPWEPGRSYARQGVPIHHLPPARLFGCFRETIRRTLPGPEREAMLGYLEGFLCHYALDRAVHPFVLYWQERLAAAEPFYSPRINQYHHRIESALDTLTLRRLTGRRIGDFRLAETAPPAVRQRDLAIGKLYRPVMQELLGLSSVRAEQLATAPADMRRALAYMTDRGHLREHLAYRPLETLLHQGPFLTALMRPEEPERDYANLAHRRWENPFTGAVSHASFFDLMEEAAEEAQRMIPAFLTELNSSRSLLPVVGNRDFAGEPIDTLAAYIE